MLPNVPSFSTRVSCDFKPEKGYLAKRPFLHNSRIRIDVSSIKCSREKFCASVRRRFVYSHKPNLNNVKVKLL